MTCHALSRRWKINYTWILVGNVRASSGLAPGSDVEPAGLQGSRGHARYNALQHSGSTWKTKTKLFGTPCRAAGSVQPLLLKSPSSMRQSRSEARRTKPAGMTGSRDSTGGRRTRFPRWCPSTKSGLRNFHTGVRATLAECQRHFRKERVTCGERVRLKRLVRTSGRE
jgi:hypothetical protein